MLSLKDFRLTKLRKSLCEHRRALPVLRLKTLLSLIPLLYILIQQSRESPLIQSLDTWGSANLNHESNKAYGNESHQPTPQRKRKVANLIKREMKTWLAS